MEALEPEAPDSVDHRHLSVDLNITNRTLLNFI